MKELIGKHLPRALIFGIAMSTIGFFRGAATTTFPPLWVELLRLFLIYSSVYLAVNVLVDWIHSKQKKD